MSFIRLATPLRSAVPRTAYRRLSTQTTPEKKSNNTALYFLGAGIAGISGYIYLTGSATAKVKATNTESPLDPKSFKDFKLKEIIPYNHNTARFVFELPNNEAALLPVASCLVVRSPEDLPEDDPRALKDSKGKPVIRPYTPVSQPDEPGVLTLLVKKYDNGVASKYIHELKVGDKLAFKGPLPKYLYKANEFEEVALIGGGSGITPLYQILTHALPDPANKTKFTLIFANLTEEDILLREEFDDLKKKYSDKFDVVYALDKPKEDWKGETGHLTGEVLKKYLAKPELGEKVKVFICGPPGQVNAIAGKKDGYQQGPLGGILKELGYKEDQVYKF
ncbi:ferredoxin reductase-like C-terminal NADP-linked domain-containing protein [Stereum hirsutum FP-91666 SS1]|uniref:ferredoxin reductase-like C-terminal NADP-linked domain-containing protein n=1 Tax=Stereum hirsutum (strain FP-91666) TaxID=721885 RepID=UPI000444A25A|nr:ferredoxin reductase-like C-terminal NADP-linked domain-containing protein [Stereum hirsutum FP-91666 SS1]EIM83228.1 ferredoxin reductase-like C-terminal NADP-linked domain-containing protein [Stereum hirsutum FP-91666 SS1]